MNIPLLAMLIGSAISTGSGIAKSRKQERYAKKLEETEKLEEERRKQQRRREALAQYMGVGAEANLADPYRYQVERPKTPYLSGYDTVAGLGDLAAKYGAQLYQ